MSKDDGSCLYLFLDEGGNLDFSPSGTRFFTLTSVAMTRPFDVLLPLAQLKYDLIEEDRNIERVHASEDRQAVRDRVFAILQSHLHDVRIDSIIVEKCRADPSLHDEVRFYPAMLGTLLEGVLSSYTAAEVWQVIVVTDRIPVSKRRRAVEKAIKPALAGMLAHPAPYRVLHHASCSSAGLQVADYCNWAIYRKWDRGDMRMIFLPRQFARRAASSPAIRGAIDGPRHTTAPATLKGRARLELLSPGRDLFTSFVDTYRLAGPVCQQETVNPPPRKKRGRRRRPCAIGAFWSTPSCRQWLQTTTTPLAAGPTDRSSLLHAPARPAPVPPRPVDRVINTDAGRPRSRSASQHVPEGTAHDP
jgi:hypothetical protein